MLERACLSYKLLMIFFCQFNSLVPTTALLVEFAGELRSVSTCRRIATESGSPVISILSGVYRDRYRKPYEEQWSRRRKTRRGCRGGETNREKKAIYYDTHAREPGCSKDREEKRSERAGEGGLWRLGMKGREVVREKRRRRRRRGGMSRRKVSRRDEATTRWHGEAGREKFIVSLSFSVAFRISGEACSKGEFNLCKFIMREHFAVYQWKSKTGIHRRARSSSFIIEPWCGPSFFPKNVQCRANNDDGERWYVLRHSFWLKVSAVLSRRCAWSLQACTTT